MISLYLRLNEVDTSALNFKQFLRKYKMSAGTVHQHSLFDEQEGCMVDEIGRFENLTNDYAHICNEFGIDSNLLNNTNASSKKQYAEYYDKEGVELVERLFSKDISYFGYEFS